MIANTGYSEISLSSLSSSDYSNIYKLINIIKADEKYKCKFRYFFTFLNDPYSVKVAEDISGGKRTGFTLHLR